MRVHAIVWSSLLLLGCSRQGHTAVDIDPALARYIADIKAVDNHTHVNTTVPADSESDALPLDGLVPFPFPARLAPGGPDWVAAYQALYGYKFSDLSPAHIDSIRPVMQRIRREQGDSFPRWVLDRIGTDVMLANRIAMGPGVTAPRFRWVSYADALMLPLSTASEREATPDYHALYPLEDRLLHRYLTDLHLQRIPTTLDAYLRDVVTATLERQRQGGCIAVKFEAAYLRALDFNDASREFAAQIYARYASGGTPSHAEYKTLQDFLFRYIAREAGRLGMAVHIHSIEGAGGYYRAAGSDPLLLEPTFNDTTLRNTQFVLVHGGGMYAAHAGAMMWKGNVYVDISMMDMIYPPRELAARLRTWLSQFPERVLFGTDAFAAGPDAGWELAAWIATTGARKALGIALTGMMRDGELSMDRAREIAAMVLRENAVKLYALK